MWKAVFLLGICLLCAYVVSGIPGGFEKVDVDDEDVLTAANHASRALSKKFAGKYHHKLAKVVKARRQIVAGTNYQMDIIVGMTNCEKDVDYDTVEDCEFREGISTYKKCTVLVYRDLKGNHKLVTSGCLLASKKDL